MPFKEFECSYLISQCSFVMAHNYSVDLTIPRACVPRGISKRKNAINRDVELRWMKGGGNRRAHSVITDEDQAHYRPLFNLSLDPNASFQKCLVYPVSVSNHLDDFASINGTGQAFGIKLPIRISTGN